MQYPYAYCTGAGWRETDDLAFELPHLRYAWPVTVTRQYVTGVQAPLLKAAMIVQGQRLRVVKTYGSPQRLTRICRENIVK